MKLILLSCALGFAASAHAADASLTVKSLSTRTISTKAAQAKARRLTPPTVSVTTVMRRTDGSFAMNCVQRPNPRLNSARATDQGGAQQP